LEVFFFKAPTKSSSWAERLTDLSRDTALDGAESKDPEDAYLAYAVRSFSTIEARVQDLLRYPPDRHGYIFSCVPSGPTAGRGRLNHVFQPTQDYRPGLLSIVPVGLAWKRGAHTDSLAPEVWFRHTSVSTGRGSQICDPLSVLTPSKAHNHSIAFAPRDKSPAYPEIEFFRSLFSRRGSASICSKAIYKIR